MLVQERREGGREGKKEEEEEEEGTEGERRGYGECKKRSEETRG